jgi:lipoprotein-anchoring transpeptidase ErfK/SrfK
MFNCPEAGRLMGATVKIPSQSDMKHSTMRRFIMVDRKGLRNEDCGKTGTAVFQKVIFAWFFIAFILLFIATQVYGQNIESVGVDSGKSSNGKSYYIEISISRNILVLYEKTSAGGLLRLREYPVGSAVRGLDIYPTGHGKVTGIYFDPWWYPTPYSRSIFRERGINIPSAVPPGHPLNYMGKFKITLSHKTKKGAIYRIHGANDPKRVGRRVTGGCFAMYNEQGLELARTIGVGTEVNILP